jgi:hypothetical protein
MIIGVVVVGYLALSNRFSLEILTVRSFLSAVFTGLAAFLAILLAVVGIEYERLTRTRKDLTEQLDALLPELPIGTRLFTDIDDYDMALRNWRQEYSPRLLGNAKEIASADSNGKMDNGLCQQFDGLSRRVIVYRRAGRRLGRFKIENRRLQRLPWNIASVFVPVGVTLLASGLFLACLDPLAAAMPSHSPAYLTISISFALIVSMGLFFSFVYSIFSRIASEEGQYWFDESGLEDLKELDKTLREIAPSVKEFREKNPPQ